MTTNDLSLNIAEAITALGDDVAKQFAFRALSNSLLFGFTRSAMFDQKRTDARTNDEDMQQFLEAAGINSMDQRNTDDEDTRGEEEIAERSEFGKNESTMPSTDLLLRAHLWAYQQSDALTEKGMLAPMGIEQALHFMAKKAGDDTDNRTVLEMLAAVNNIPVEQLIKNQMRVDEQNRNEVLKYAAGIAMTYRQPSSDDIGVWTFDEFTPVDTCFQYHNIINKMLDEKDRVSMQLLGGRVARNKRFELLANLKMITEGAKALHTCFINYESKNVEVIETAIEAGRTVPSSDDVDFSLAA